MKKITFVVAAALVLLCAQACKKKEETPPAAPPPSAPTPTAQPPAAKTAVVTAGPLNLREGPGTKTPVVGRLNQGEKVLVLERSAAGETIDGKSAYWYRVETVDKKQGWVFGGYLDLGAAEAPPATAGSAGTAVSTGTGTAPLNVEATNVAGWGAADYYNKGKALAAGGAYAEALPYLKAAQELSPQTGKYWFELGLALQQLGRDVEAVTAYEKAVTLLPDDFWAHNNLGLACIKAGQPRRAVEALEKAINMEPRGVADPAEAKKTARANLAVAYQMNGQPDKAEALR